MGIYFSFVPDRTLSPMDSFATELGVPFITRMEGQHVIDTSKQVNRGWESPSPECALPAVYGQFSCTPWTFNDVVC